MIEMLGVLAIIGVLSAGGIMGYSAAMENYKVNKFINMVQTNVQNTMYFTHKNMRGGANYLMAEHLCQIGILPQELCKTRNGQYVTGYFGEKIQIYTLFQRTGQSGEEGGLLASDGKTVFLKRPMTYTYFKIYTPISHSVCVKLMTHQGWKNIGELSGIYYPEAREFPLTPEVAQSTCKSILANFTNINLISFYDSAGVSRRQL